MTDSEAYLNLALEAVRKQSQQAEGHQFKSRLVGAAILCTRAAAALIMQAASLKEIRALYRRRRR